MSSRKLKVCIIYDTKGFDRADCIVDERRINECWNKGGFEKKRE